MKLVPGKTANVKVKSCRTKIPFILNNYDNVFMVIDRKTQWILIMSYNNYNKQSKLISITKKLLLIGNMRSIWHLPSKFVRQSNESRHSGVSGWYCLLINRPLLNFICYKNKKDDIIQYLIHCIKVVNFVILF